MHLPNVNCGEFVGETREVPLSTKRTYFVIYERRRASRIVCSKELNQVSDRGRQIILFPACYMNVSCFLQASGSSIVLLHHPFIPLGLDAKEGVREWESERESERRLTRMLQNISTISTGKTRHNSLMYVKDN